MFKVLYNHVNNITYKYYKFTTISYYIYNDRKEEKLKLKLHIQIYPIIFTMIEKRKIKTKTIYTNL